MTSASLIGVSLDSGIPLFVRHSGPGNPPPYAMIGSLNGLQVFGEAHGAKLWNSETEKAAVYWKSYGNCIRLILIRGSECNGALVDCVLLDLAFSSLVLIAGHNNLSISRSVEKLKRDIKPCYPILDEILARSLNNKDTINFSPLSKCVEYIMPPDQLNIQLELEKFTEMVETSYGCLMLISGKILFATKSFWSLSSTEILLLPLLVSAKHAMTAVGKDIPVFLPDKSPDVPFRMLLLKLTGSLVLLLLCGPTPQLPQVLKTAFTFWTSHSLTLEAIADGVSCSIPTSVHSLLDQAIQGLFLINYSAKRSVSCLHSRDRQENGSSKGHKIIQDKVSVINAAYRTLVGSVFQLDEDPPKDSSHTPIHAYLTLDDYKVFALQKMPYHMFILLPPIFPLNIARDVSWKAFDVLTKGKSLKM